MRGDGMKRLPVPDPLGILTDISKGSEVELFDPIREKILDNPRTREETPEEEWQSWQKYYIETLYRPPGENEPHEFAFAQTILAAKSPAEAITLLTRSFKKHPSSVGADMADEFKRLWTRTRTDVRPPHRRLKHPGYIQIDRPLKMG
jgi:hypothetical protein